MGAVIETYNAQLMAMADYSNRKKLKTLYRNYYNLEALSEAGDGVAACIFIDLKVALNSAVLTPLQRECIEGLLIHRDTAKDLAFDIGKSESTINQAVNGGLKNIQKALLEGTLYGKKP